MKIKQNDFVSLILRLTLGLSFLLAGGQKMFFQENLADRYLGPNGFIGDIFANLIPNLADIVYYSGILQTIIGFLLIFGIFTRMASILAMIWASLTIIINPTFIMNPITGILRLNQILAHIGIALTIFLIGAPDLSFDKFLFPFKGNSKKLKVQIEDILIYSLGISFALTFAGIFLWINDGNYVWFYQWHILSKTIPVLNITLLGGFLSVAAVLIFLGYAKRVVAFLASIFFLGSLMTSQPTQAEVLPLLGAAIAVFSLPNKGIRATKIIPKRKKENRKK